MDSSRTTVARGRHNRASATQYGNVVGQYFAKTGDSFDNYRAGWCGPLTHKVSQWLKLNNISHQRLMITRAAVEGDVLYPSAKQQPNTVWYHAIIALNGIVHCPWLNERLTVADYCARMFPAQNVTVEEDYSCCTGMVRFNEAEAA